ncbi:hypothetical protein RINTHM_10450 [Richelia intracellularis HM01]|uniref:Cof-type HAD-IIB family hydrolase n=1 Tax=Richelia intracellularis TaxID=1164990 RepID=UPI0002B59588|nr:Cof-type HAD-IIB family hydrolase [Richelia intracellularis]CCH65505.1 hypothetical protein RINTHM_10450 [Richelia intracellularis HM01]
MQDAAITANTKIPNPDIKLLVVDIDGTIVGDDNSVRKIVKQAINRARAKGIRTAIATGRMYCSALQFYKEVISDLPIIAYQGAWIQEPITNVNHCHLVVPRLITEKLLEYFEQPKLRDILSVHFYINDKLYVRELSQDTKAYAQRSGVKPIPVGDLRKTLDNEPTKILALCQDHNIINQLMQNIRYQYNPNQLYLTKSLPTFLEAAHPQVNKGTAVKYLAEEILGLLSRNVMTIGDNFNDLEMIEYAGIGVAMSDAPAPVKAAAQWVAPSFKEDGVAVAINRFLLGNSRG